jgi:hypothetical protein
MRVKNSLAAIDTPAILRVDQPHGFIAMHIYSGVENDEWRDEC